MVGSGREGHTANGGAGGELAARLLQLPFWPMRPYMRMSAGFLLFLRGPFLPGSDFYDIIIGIGIGAGLELPLGPRLSVIGDLHATRDLATADRFRRLAHRRVRQAAVSDRQRPHRRRRPADAHIRRRHQPSYRSLPREAANVGWRLGQLGPGETSVGRREKKSKPRRSVSVGTKP